MTLLEARNILDVFYGSPLQVISDSLRGFLIAKEGHDFIAADFSAIEARVLAWLAGQESVLGIFRGHGKIYEHAASGIYRVPIDEVTSHQRQIGKTAILALGFQGGKVAFKNMAKTFNVEISENAADEIKIAWREANPLIVSYWYDLERAAMSAIANPGKVFKAGAKNREISFVKNGSFLFSRLPSSRCICYPYPRNELFETPWGVAKEGMTYMGVSSQTNKWERQKAYGGLLCENATQGVARDLLAEAMLRLEDKNYPVVIHVHDEIVTEVPKDFGSVDEMVNIMTELSVWAEGLPLKAEGWRGDRFRK